MLNHQRASDPQPSDLDAQDNTQPVPSQEQIQQLADQSDDSVVSQQQLEATQPQPQGKMPLPAGEKEDEVSPLDKEDEEILRADMVNPGD